MAAALPLILFPFCLLAAAISDARRFIIPNELSILLIAGFGVAAFLTGMSPDDIGWSLLAALAMLAVGFALFCFNIFGAGDAKILAAIALWFGWPSFFVALVYVTIAGGLLSLVIVLAALAARWFPGISARSKALSRLAATSRNDLKSPYGIAIAIGSLAAFQHSPLFQALIAKVI